MILWQGKQIKDLSDDELMDAINSLAHMDNFRIDKLKDPRLNNSKHRLGKIHKSNPLNENPAFTNLLISLNSELNNRKSKNDTQE